MQSNHQILSDFVIPSRTNQHWKYSGIDSLNECLDREHFLHYPYSISYDYNCRGFRDSEWPTDIKELEKSIWCVGDSFTVGIGSPLNHTWPSVLQNTLNLRTINVSMDGASNNWIARKCQSIIQEIHPEFLIVQWSYISRREKYCEKILEQSWQRFYSKIKDPEWPNTSWKNIDQLPANIIDEIYQVHGGWYKSHCDEDFRLMSARTTIDQDIKNLSDCMTSVMACADSKTKIFHSFIPNFAPADHKDLTYDTVCVLSDLCLPEIVQLDRARDGHHYDILTSRAFVSDLVQRIDSD